MGNKFFFVASMVRRRWATISTDGDGYSLGAAAEGDAVSDGELADLDAVVGGEGLVELEDEVAVVADVLAHGRVGGEHDGSVPEGVVVAEESADLDELHEALVVVEVVVLVGVDEDEVEGAVVGLVLQQRVQDRERRALAEVDLVRDAGLLDARQADGLVVLAVDVHGQDLHFDFWNFQFHFHCR